jgi:formylglycine-generating enzyme required for sulfatase activity
MNDDAPIDFRLVIEGSKGTNTYRASLVSGPNKEPIRGLEPMTFDASALIALAKKRGESAGDLSFEPTEHAQLRQERHWLTRFDDLLQAALGALHERLAEYRRRADIRLWIEAPEELQKLPFEALGGFAELRGWQVVRDVSSRIGGTTRNERSPSSLTKVLVVVGDVSQEALVPQATTNALAVVRELASVRVADSHISVVVLCAASTYDAAPSEWEKLGERAVRVFPLGREPEFVQLITQHADANALVVLAHGEHLHSNDAPAGRGDGANAFRLVRKSASKSDDDLLTASRLAEALGSRSRVRLALLLACEAQYAMVAALPTIDHVIGFLAPITPASAQAVARRLFQSFARPGTATVGAAVREARSALDDDLLPNGDPAAWCLAHWATAGRDAPFVDPHAQVVSKANAMTARTFATIDSAGHRAAESAIDLMAVQLSVRRLVDVERAAARSGARRADSIAREQALEIGDLRGSVDFRWLVFGDAGQTGRHGLRRRTTVVRGGPGSGKTTSCRSLARELARGDLGLLVVYVRLVELARHLYDVDEHGGVTAKPGKSEGFEAIAQLAHANSRLIDVGADFAAYWKALCVHRDTGRLVVFLDGLDEVRVPEVHRRLRELARCLQPENGAGATIVVTSRPSAVLEIAGAHDDAEILPLDREQQLDLLARWRRAQGARAEDARTAANNDLRTLLDGDRSERLRELFRVPLFLALAARHLVDGGTFTAQRVHGFLDDAVLDLLQGRHRRGTDALLPVPKSQSTSEWRDQLEEQLPLFERLAFGMTTAGLVDVSRTQAIELLIDRPRSCDAGEGTRVDEALAAWRTEPNDKPKALAGRFVDAARRNGLFAPRDATRSDDDTGEWGFVHRYFQESLASRYLAHGAFDEITGTVTGLLGATPEKRVETWHEPLALLTSRLAVKRAKDAESWVAFLLGQPSTRTIGLAAITLADALPAPVLVKAIDELGEWKETRALYAHLAGQGGALAPEVNEAVVRRAKARVWMLGTGQGTAEMSGCAIEAELAADLVERKPIERAGRLTTSGTNSVVSLFDVPSAADLPDGTFAWVPGLEPTAGRAGVPWLAPIVPRGSKGRFRMGPEVNEPGRFDWEWGPVDGVEVGEFWMARAPITVGQFQLFIAQHRFHWEEAQLPAHGIDWYAARLYCRWLTNLVRSRPEVLLARELDRATRESVDQMVAELRAGRLEFRLPKDSEWEYAARGRLADGSARRELFGRTTDGDQVVWAELEGGGERQSEQVALGAAAVLDSNSNGKPAFVASKLATTPARLFDMHGNVLEWCLDAWRPLENVRPDRFLGGTPDAGRVLRGGCCWSDALWCRSACRVGLGPGDDGGGVGFRVVLAPPLFRL